MKEISIYLAGKIEPNGWRQSIFNMRDMFCGADYYASKNNAYTLKNTHVHIDKYDCDFSITGPFFLACDHSCYHGEGTHGLGKGNEYDCYGYGRNYTEQEVVDICKAQIKNADIVFAYIDDDTCYGTLFELGLAKQMGKQIVTIFDNEERKKKMWFIAANSDYSATLLDDEENAFSYFETVQEAFVIINIIYDIKRYKKYPH